MLSTSCSRDRCTEGAQCHSCTFSAPQTQMSPETQGTCPKWMGTFTTAWWLPGPGYWPEEARGNHCGGNGDSEWSLCARTRGQLDLNCLQGWGIHLVGTLLTCTGPCTAVPWIALHGDAGMSPALQGTQGDPTSSHSPALPARWDALWWGEAHPLDLLTEDKAIVIA